MKKVLLARGMGLSGLWMVLVVLGALLFLAPSSFAQTYELTFIGFPTGNVDLSVYIGLDRKLKADVPGHVLHISISPPLTRTQSARLSLMVSATGSTVSECNIPEIAWAQTKPFDLTGAGRDLGASAFTGSSAIGVQSSRQNQRCIDALVDKIQKGVASIPAGIYTVTAMLNDAATGQALGTGSHTITITSASANEDVVNLTSPQNGELVTEAPSIVFAFNNPVPGRLLAFEHSSFAQSPEDATRDLSSPLKILDVPVAALGSNQVVAAYPGVALRPWIVGERVSWLFLGDSPSLGAPPRSPIWSFVVVSNDPVFTQLTTALSTAPDPLGSTFINLINSGYTLAFSSSNPIYLQEGGGGIPRTVDIEQVLALLADLARRNIRINTTVTSQ